MNDSDSRWILGIMVIDFLIAEMQLNLTVFMKLCLLLMVPHHPD